MAYQLAEWIMVIMMNIEHDDEGVDDTHDDDDGIIEGQEGRKLTSSLRSIFHFMLSNV